MLSNQVPGSTSPQRSSDSPSPAQGTVRGGTPEHPCLALTPSQPGLLTCPISSSRRLLGLGDWQCLPLHGPGSLSLCTVDTSISQL